MLLVRAPAGPLASDLPIIQSAPCRRQGGAILIGTSGARCSGGGRPGVPCKEGPMASATTRGQICLLCRNDETCIYPKPEGGVWRCEEYR